MHLPLEGSVQIGGSNSIHHAERLVSARHSVRTMIEVQLSKFCMSQSEQQLVQREMHKRLSSFDALSNECTYTVKLAKMAVEYDGRVCSLLLLTELHRLAGGRRCVKRCNDMCSTWYSDKCSVVHLEPHIQTAP